MWVVPELVEEDVTGLPVPPGDPAAMSAALRRILEDRSLRKRMGEARRRRVLGRFTVERMIEVYKQIYRAVAAELESREPTQGTRKSPEVKAIFYALGAQCFP